MSNVPSLSAFLANQVQRLLQQNASSIEDLTPDELHSRAHENTNSIGFDAWHIARTADNLINFAFQRKPPVWIAQGLNDAWNLPKADQGTGMDAETAHALRFPEAKLLAQYSRDVAANIVPQIEAMSDDDLTATMVIKPQGEMAKLDIIAQVVIVHNHAHLGHINIALTAQGLPGLGF